MTRKTPPRKSGRFTSGGPAGRHPSDGNAIRSSPNGGIMDWLLGKSKVRVDNATERPKGSKPAGGKGPKKGDKPGAQ